MESLNYQNKPEERIRQAWIQTMIQDLGYPKQWIAIEKELSSLPHLSLIPKKELPKRRVDILVFAPHLHPDYPLYPLLMIECKVAPLEPKFAHQVLGYNTYVQAPFIALANQQEILVGTFDAGANLTRFTRGLPSFKDLLHRISK